MAGGIRENPADSITRQTIRNGEKNENKNDQTVRILRTARQYSGKGT